MRTSTIFKTVSAAVIMILWTACGTSQPGRASNKGMLIPDRESNGNVVPLGSATTGQEGNRTTTPTPAYRVHENITATLFWIGESESPDNHDITNVESAWDDSWLKHYGGIDTPHRTTVFPDFVPQENPFYFALPYSDFDDNGNRRDDALKKIPWAGEKTWSDEASMVKNRWIKITAANGKTAYAQWEDAGPFADDDIEYVFGTAAPHNAYNDHAGLDLSPAVWIYLGYDTRNADNAAKMRWQFVDPEDVPDGPWMNVVTYSQINWQ